MSFADPSSQFRSAADALGIDHAMHLQSEVHFAREYASSTDATPAQNASAAADAERRVRQYAEQHCDGWNITREETIRQARDAAENAARASVPPNASFPAPPREDLAALDTSELVVELGTRLERARLNHPGGRGYQARDLIPRRDLALLRAVEAWFDGG